MSESGRRLHLLYNLSGTGHHLASWRHPDTAVSRALLLDHYVELARTAERGLFDAVFLADVPALSADPQMHLGNTPFEPVTLLSAIAARTRHIGVVPTVSTTYSDPYATARQIASLDLLSGGRAGVNLVASAGDQVARNHGRPVQPAHADRYVRANEFLEVLLRLWSGWDPDAIVADKERALLTRPGGIRATSFHGDHLAVDGPLDVPPSLQGRPLISQAGASPDGVRTAGRFADIVYLRSASPEAAAEDVQRIRQAALDAGRDPRDVAVLPGLVPYVGSTRAEADRLHADLQSLHVVSPQLLNRLGGLLGIDLSDASPGDPVPLERLPNEDEFTGSVTSFVQLRHFAANGATTLGQLAQHLASDAPLGMSAIIGDPNDIADELERWWRLTGADGFVLMFPLVPGTLTDFVEQVVPLLQQRGIYPASPGVSGLRERLRGGIPERSV